jgi:signal transduction histidine kinase
MQDTLISAPALRIFVVDDIAASREHLCTLVQQLGHEVCTSGNGAMAVEQIIAQAPDLILLDLWMPDMDGFEVMRRLRALVTQRWLPVIVTSSLEGEEHFIEALQQGADDYLIRPINPALLAAKLRHYAQVLGLQSRLAVLAQRQRDIHDNILDAVLTLDGRGHIEEANLAAMRIFGNGADRLDGLHCKTVLGLALPVLLEQCEVLLCKSDGTVFPAELSLSEWTQATGICYTVVIRDLTERHRVERMKDEFLATVSHELRTPLTSIIGALGLLSSGAAGALPTTAVPLAEVAKRNSERLSHLIDDILDLTKLEGHQMVLQLRPTRLDTLLHEAMTANQGYAERAGVKLSAVIPECPPQVRVDADRFLQIMANLLSNAIKHSPQGEVVQVSMDWSATQVWVKVRDRGPGIDPQFRSHIFEKFSQADSSDRRSKGGTGLGLYITRILAERMGARVEVDSVAGGGATFMLQFPIVDAKHTGTEPWLLHIDSDVDARARLAEWLTPLYMVESVADLQQAKGPFFHTQAPIVIADPKGQGSAEEFCTALHQVARGQPVILYSDVIDDHFVDRVGLGWLQKSKAGRQELLLAVCDAIEKINQRSLS